MSTPPPRPHREPARPDREGLSADLVTALEAMGPRPALGWNGVEGRIELSGHVLANWIIKSANHLGEDVGLAPGETVRLHLAPHWKRLVLALATWSLGARVELGPPHEPIDARVLATDDPEVDGAAGIEEVLALEAASLSLRFPHELPPLVRDWAEEVRGSGDALTVPLAPWSGPLPAPAPGTDRPGTTVTFAGDALEPPGDGGPVAILLGAWLVGGRGELGTPR